MTDAEKFIADLERDLLEGTFHPPTPEQDAALDRLFAMIKPCFERALEERIAAGILRRRGADE